MVELQGLRGTGVLVFEPSLLFNVFDLLLGAKPGGGSVDAEDIINRRGMTAVEKRLYGRIVRMISAEMTNAWNGVAHIGMRPIRVETDPKQLAIFEPNEMIVDTRFEIEIGDLQGSLQIIVPQGSLRPVEKKLASGLLDIGGDETASWANPLMDLMQSVTVLCTAELGRTKCTVRELMSLQKGDVIRLDRDPVNPVTLYVEGIPKLLGSPTLQHGNIALEVVSVVTSTDDKTKSSQEAQNG
jgi:flagellar motor switch protein FliM